MTQVILDTSAYSTAGRGDTRLKEWLKPEITIIVPIIVIAELRAGFLAGHQPAKNERDLQRFLAAPNVMVVAISDATTRKYAEIFVLLRKAGRPIGMNDMWIASIALEHDLPLLTLDADFGSVAGLKLVKLEQHER